MAIELGSAYVTILPDMGKFKGQIQKALPETIMDKSGEDAGRNFITKAGGSAKKWAKRSLVGVMVGVGGVIGTALTTGFQRSIKIENAEATLSGLGYNDKEIEGIVSQALSGVKGTSFGLDDAVTLSSGALAAGITDVEGYIKSVGDVATITQKGLDETGAIFNKVMANNRLSAEEMNQLADAGIPVLKLIQDEYGVTADEARKMVSEGKIDAQDFLGLMEVYEGAALESGNTTQGSFNNMRAALARLGQAALEEVFPHFKTAFQGATKFIDNMTDNVRKHLPTVIEWLKDMASTLRDRLEPVVKSVFGWIKDTAIPAVQNFIAEFKNGEGAGGKFKNALVTIKDAVKTAFDYVKTDVIPVLKDMWQWVKDNSEELKTAALYVGTLGAAILAYKGYVAAAQLATKLHTMWINRQTVAQKLSIIWTKAMTAAQKLLNLAMKMNPIGLVIAAITGLIGILVVAYNRHEGFRNLVDNVWKKIKEVSLSVVEWFKNTAWPWMRDALGKIRDAFTTAKDKAVAAFDGIKNGISNAWDGVNRIFGRFRNGIQSIKDKFQSVKDGIARTWSTLGAAIAKPINTVIKSVNDFLEKVRKGLNKIPGVSLTGTWGNIPSVPVPGALTSSASTAGRRTSGGAVMLAAGGQVPGWSPNDRADNIPAWLTAGEFVLPVKATERLRSALGADGLEHLRRGNLPGYANGGAIGDGRGGVIGWAKDKWDDVVGFFENAKGWVKGLWNRLMPNFGNSWAGQAVKGIMGKIDMGKIADAVMEKAGGALGGLNASGSNAAMPWQAIWSLVQSIAPEARMTSNFRPGARTAGYGNLSYHARGRAIDIVSNDMMSTYRKVVGALPWSELIFSPAGARQVRNGRYYMETNPVTRSQHWDHIHLAMAKGGLVPDLYDRGGMIQPGLSLVANQTGKPEMVLTNDQWTDIREGSGGNTIVINGVNTDNASEVADELLFAMRRTRKGKYNRVR